MLEGYVKQGSTYYPAGQQQGVVPPAGYYPVPGGQQAPGFYSQGQGPNPAGYYAGQPVPSGGAAQGYYGAAGGYPAGNTVVVREQPQSSNRVDDLAKCCLGTCCLTWFCCWLTD
ncbi:conserved hypothetical protein [Ixodes scapularis]|uniref:Cysteine-rich transmembrane CYSTM domain-containing protein n=1 Tax=Ixodes scapularis TaxID=6945 RepID=B7PMA0_IXOSC|nr:conserved hypothetical protein [Ixodes scapularis]|eukprot:XP_002434898.1 conserved hypothetical protein [Ixodes scapularis]